VMAMARKTRQRAQEATEPVATEASGATTPMTREPEEQPEPREEEVVTEAVVPEAVVPEAEDTGDETVVIEVPQPATTPGGDRDPDAGDPSLKKLFWGDDR